MTQRYYSNIYWHFTGSPKGIDWRKVKCPNDILMQAPILSSQDATATLIKILNSRVLLGRCTEKVLEGLETKPFCCVTDIPVKDLPTHAPYYGRVAIGFRAAAAHKSFLPVLYVPRESLPLIETLVPNRTLTKMAYEAWGSQGSFQEQLGYKLHAQAAANKEPINEPDSAQISGFFMNFLKFTDFATSPENTFYREREWRNLGDFNFSPEDVAAIVVPEEHMAEVRHMLDKMGYPQSISILAWEFIENA
jgi:hypothetical protein